MTKLLAHSKDDEKMVSEQPYENHIHGVLNNCKRHLERLKKCTSPDIFLSIERVVLLASEYHDLGKLDDQAQAILRQDLDGKLINHVDAGVAYLLSLYQSTDKLEYLAASYIIHAHHIGYIDFDKIINRTRKRLKITYTPSEKFRDSKSCVKYNMKDTEVCKHVDNNLKSYIKKHDGLVKLEHPISVSNKSIKTLLNSYMILKVALSILCDSDHEDTAKHYNQIYPSRHIPINAKKRMKKLENFVSNLNSTTPRDTMRAEFFRKCNRPMASNISVIDGTVGIGKTFGMMAHALRTIAQNDNLDSLFIVLPYIALIDQSADVYKKAITFDERDVEWSINEVHSILDPKNFFHRKYVRGFNAPINLTTSVNFFETITSNRTGVLKNIHKMVGSVICIDEYQEIASVEHWRFLLALLNEMIKFFNCKIILASGTPISYWNIDAITGIGEDKSKVIDIDEFDNVEMIINEEYRKRMLAEEHSRVRIINHSSQLYFEDLYKLLLRKYGSVFIVFNTRKKAFGFTKYCEKRLRRKVYLRFSGLVPSDRRKQLKNIKLNMQKGNSIILIATQGSEVGLDLSFHHGFKEMSNYNSVLQMKGRVNRSEEFKDSTLTTFYLKQHPNRNDEIYYENPILKSKLEALEKEFNHYLDFSPSNCTAVTELEIDNMTPNSHTIMKELASNFNNLSFDKMAKEFRLIKIPMIKILVNKDIFERMMADEWIPYHLIQDNVVNMIMSKHNVDKIKMLSIPLNRQDGKYHTIDLDDNKEEDNCEDEMDYNDLYFWIGEYDPDNYGIMKGMESGKIVNIPNLIF